MTIDQRKFEASGDLNARVRGGTRAVLASLVVSQVVSFGVLAVMCRLIVPDAYGLLGQILPALMLTRMAATLGLATAVVQHPELSHKQLSQLFWFNLLGGVLATAVTAGIGPILATAYGRPELMTLCFAMAGTNLLASLMNQHSAMLERTLQMTRLSIVRCTAQAVGGVAGVSAAMIGYDVGALMALQYAELVALVIGVWIAMPWMPGLPRRDAGVRSVVAFSSYFSLSSLVGYVSQNLEKLVFPILLGPNADRAIGLYSQAFNLMIKPVFLITAPLTGVMVAALSRARGDRRVFAEMTTGFFRLAAIGLLPCAAGLFAVAPDFMLVLAGPEWKDSGVILSALAPAIVAQGFVNLAGFMLASIGKASQLLFASMICCLLLVQAFVVGYYAGGYAWPTVEGASMPTVMGPMLGIAIGYTVVMTAVWMVPFLWFCFRSTGTPVGDVVQKIGPLLRPATLMGLIVWGLRQVLMNVEEIGVGPRLAILVATGVAIYSLLARRELQWFMAEWIHLRDEKKPAAKGR
jgi:O-antigen/teichoic acid export membrane protein